MKELIYCESCGWRGTLEERNIEFKVNIYYTCPKCGSTNLEPNDLVGAK